MQVADAPVTFAVCNLLKICKTRMKLCLRSLKLTSPTCGQIASSYTLIKCFTLRKAKLDSLYNIILQNTPSKTAWVGEAPCSDAVTQP